MIPAKRGQDCYNQEYRSKRPSKGSKEIFICFGVASCIVALLILYLFQSMQFTELSYQLQQSKEELETLRKENFQLELEVANLSALDRIERIARDDLGMLDPNQMKYVVLHPRDYERAGSLDEDGVGLNRMIKDLVFNWFEIISKVEAGALFD